jgi:hypothetical protein
LAKSLGLSQHILTHILIFVENSLFLNNRTEGTNNIDETNQQRKKDRKQNEIDYQINLKKEPKIRELDRKLDIDINRRSKPNLRNLKFSIE